jgi:hypothetical protein
MELPRSIREEKEFSAAMEAAGTKYPRLEDWWMAWSWRLARMPSVDAIVVPGSTPQAYMLKTDVYDVYGAPPPSTLLYRFDDQFVDMIDVKFP